MVEYLGLLTTSIIFIKGYFCSIVMTDFDVIKLYAESRESYQQRLLEHDLKLRVREKIRLVMVHDSPEGLLGEEQSQLEGEAVSLVSQYTGSENRYRFVAPRTGDFYRLGKVCLVENFP